MNVISHIRLDLQDYGVNKGKLTGEIKVVNEYGEIAIRVDPEKAAAIVRILAPALVATAQDLGNMMIEQIEAQTRMLPAIEAVAS